MQGRAATLSSGQYGPAVSTNFSLSRYTEANDYLGDLVNPSTGQRFAKGTHFDLDEYNGRTCVTPEFPNGTYAYFVAISASGTPMYPYNLGRQYYGTPSGGSVTSIAEMVTTNLSVGPNTQEQMNPPSISASNVAVSWKSVEGGTYKLEAANDLSAT